MKPEAHAKETHTKHGSKITTDLNEIKKWAESREGNL